MTIEMPSYEQFSSHLQRTGIGYTAAELHGLLSGMISGGISDSTWLPLLFQFTNDDHTYPTSILKETSLVYEDIKQKLSDIDGFNFELWLPESDDVFQRANGLSEWVNHFLLGLGLARPQFMEEIKDPDMQEAINDIKDICLLNYELDDDPEEISNAIEEIGEYLRTVATLLFTQFRPIPQSSQKLH